MSTPVAADCRLALVLALDVSSSVDAQEYTLQRDGLAAALIAPEVRRAFFASDLPVALSAYEWSGRHNQELILDWHLIDSPAALLDAAETIARTQRSQTEYPTAMGFALGYGAGVMRRAPPCLFRTIDISGDGKNNEGFPPANAYAEFPFAGVTVNGLVVNAAEFEAEVSLIEFYRDHVLHGAGAFLEVAQGFEDFERAMRRKLERELTVRVIGAPIPPDLNAPG
ncbi:DUF1194 domain-containing protein [Sedimentitalea nanhaiensis]|uniref:VWFA domain-containing protein n=1 Tax=Sedimentitalea nanhaiensis TaxID=999627 RepID=A0A1I6ZGJ0_9RHOB|nr:DUF1194 domain-containing protein [Sedimentitalea nanhaiensis]SFT61793.1 Protein of unknown function [Sedimentitalea nanhaiensis]